MTNLFVFIVYGFVFLALLYFAILSVYEKEFLAAKRSGILALVLLLIALFTLWVNEPLINHISLIISYAIVAFAVLIFLPFKKSSHQIQTQNDEQIDERDTMFSRLEISKQPSRKEEYYKIRPENLSIDNEWRKKPGLGSEHSLMYNPLLFSASDASFATIEKLRPHVDGDVASVKAKTNVNETSQFVKQWIRNLGAIEVGICATKKYHFYSHRGRREKYSQAVINHHSHAIAFTVEMDKYMLASGPQAPTLMESAQQYLNSGAIAIQVAQFIRNLGYEAKAHIDGEYEVVCPLVARDAGLGEIGRMGLLMSNKLGPRVRIAVITTNYPFAIDEYKHDASVEEFCSLCKKCADICPSKAISSEDKKVIRGNKRWQINQEKCFSYWCITGTDCGRCMSVCPYSHPNNLAHNTIRWGIKNSAIFQKLALHLDNFFYGRKAKPRNFPAWLKTHKEKI